jgi:hypothetical protein
MDKEHASYILKFFPRLLNEKEARAKLHQSAIFKLNGVSNKANFENLMHREGLLSDDPEVMQLLKDGYDVFESQSADRIMKESPDKVYFNNCPQCGKLARTPQAKQCRFCGRSWHEQIVAAFQVINAFQVKERAFYLLGDLLSGKVKIGMKIDLTILGIGRKPLIEAIDFALHREENTSWEDIGLGISALDDSEKEYIKSHTPFAAPLLIEM